jgi:hypothetical protein
MIPFLNSTRSFVTTLLLLLLITVLFRQSIHNNNVIYDNYDATHHVLLTIEALKQTLASQYHFLPIVSFGKSTDKHIPWSTTILDKYGNVFLNGESMDGFNVGYPHEIKVITKGDK